MKIFKLKYKMHKFVNYIFYLAIFVFGFFVGLMINSVSAEELDTTNSYTICRDSVNLFDINNINIYSTNNANYTTENDALRIFSTGSYSSIDLLLDLEIGKTYTFSADVVNTLTDGRANVSIFTLDYTNRYVEQYVFTQIGKFNMTFTPVSSPTLFRIYSNASNDISDNYVTLSNIQVQLGDCQTEEDTFYSFSQKIFGEVDEESEFIYDFITLGLVCVCFTLFILVVGYIFKKIFGG